MPLPIFNLAQHVKKHNETHQTNYVLDENFGFAYFEKELWQQTKAAILSVNQGTDNYLLSQDERLALKKRNHYYQHYQNYLKGLNPEPAKSSEEAQAVVWAVYQKVQYWNWVYKNLGEWKKPETWEKWEFSLTFEQQLQLKILKAAVVATYGLCSPF